MKKYVLFLKIVSILFLSLLFSCVDYPEYDRDPIDKEIILKSANGYTSESGQEFFVQQNVMTILSLEVKNKTVSNIYWTVEDESYKGKQITHKFQSLGEQEIGIIIEFSDNSSVNKTFVVNCVIDITEKDPIKMFFNQDNDDNVEILMLVSQERLIQESDKYYFIGTMTNWEKQEIKNYQNYIIDSNGDYQVTDDIGAYLGFAFEIKNQSANHEIAIVLNDGSWIDLNGSAFVDLNNYTKAKFYYESTTEKLIPFAEYGNDALPGDLGDLVFRFQINEENVSVYFNFEDIYQYPFIRIKNENGEYLPYKKMSYLDSYENWAKIVLAKELFTEKIVDMRFGKDYREPDVFLEIMEKSSFYDNYFNSIRLSLVNFE